MPPILPTPLFLWKKFEPPLFLKILKTQPSPLFIKVPTVDRGISYNKGLLLVVYNIQTEFKANFSCRSIYNLFTIALTHWHTEFWWVIFLALTV